LGVRRHGAVAWFTEVKWAWKKENGFKLFFDEITAKE
jgi:hypothetical protein